MAKILLKNVKQRQIGELLQEAAQAGDEQTVADCIKLSDLMVSGAKIDKNVKCARRILRILNRAKAEAAE